jgi:cupin fold WbuC family metalloprotein
VERRFRLVAQSFAKGPAMTKTAMMSELLRVITPSQFLSLTKEATKASRKRSHLLLHSGHTDQVQRLIIAAQSGTYVRPHQHSKQWEILVLLRGCFDVLTFGPRGELLERKTLDENVPFVEIPMLTWHTSFVRKKNTVILEIKPGPYRSNEFANWAPSEATKQAVNFLRWMKHAKIGQSWPPVA